MPQDGQPDGPMLPAPHATPPPRAALARRLGVLAAVIGVLAALHLSGATGALDFETLADHRADLRAWVDDHAVLGVGVFVAIYAGAVAVSLPGAVWLTIGGGFLFGPWLGGAAAAVAATAGASLVFLLARYVTGEAVQRRLAAGSARFARLEAGVRANAFSALLAARLIPVFPFWLVNLVPAVLGVPLGTYVLATALGILPATFVFAGLGAGLDEVVARGEQPDLSLLWEPRVLLPLVGLAGLALLPIAWKRWKRKERTAWDA